MLSSRLFPQKKIPQNQIILIGSILKPVDEIRMYKKIAQSLAKNLQFEVHLFGQGNKRIKDAIIHFHPLKPFRRIAWMRLFAPWKCLILMIKLRPKVVIATTYELLIVMSAYRIIFGGILIYDVQENFFENIRNSHSFNTPLREILAKVVRTIEHISAPFIDHFLLAERCYSNQLPFLKPNRTTVLENLYKGGLKSKSESQKEPLPFNLLLSGTLSPYYGTLEAIHLAITLDKNNIPVKLYLVGFAPDRDFHQNLLTLIKPYSFITLIAEEEPLSYDEIIKYIRIADFGLLSYPSKAYTKDRIPTKLYEYLALQLPIIINDNQTWQALCQKYEASINIDFYNFDSQKLANDLLNKKFFSLSPGREILWESQEEKLLTLFL